MAFALILWLHAGDTASRFQNVLLFVELLDPGVRRRGRHRLAHADRGRASINPAEERTDPVDAVAAVVVFVLAYAAAVPFMNTSLFQGPVAESWHGADIAYFVNFVVAALLYGGYRLLRGRPANLDKYNQVG